MSNNALQRLAATIRARRAASVEDSYTKRLLAEPIKPAKKVGEEGVEVALISETADLLYHLLVVLESRDVTLDEIFDELERRMAAPDQKKAASA